jgi:hypothetical protein
LKILPSNQSLILAGEPGGPRARPPAGGASLQRLTILTARQDSTVVVQADYFSHDEALPFDSQLPELSASANDAVTSGSANYPPPSRAATSLPATSLAATSLATTSRSATISSYLNPIELYTRTQRGLTDTSKPALLDVLA